jgi:hypothetical protein
MFQFIKPVVKFVGFTLVAELVFEPEQKKYHLIEMDYCQQKMQLGLDVYSLNKVKTQTNKTFTCEAKLVT